MYVFFYVSRVLSVSCLIVWICRVVNLLGMNPVCWWWWRKWRYFVGCLRSSMVKSLMCFESRVIFTIVITFCDIWGELGGGNLKLGKHLRVEGSGWNLVDKNKQKSYIRDLHNWNESALLGGGGLILKN